MKILHVSSYYMDGMGYQENGLTKFQARDLGNEGKVSIFTSERNFPFKNYDRTYFSKLGPRIRKNTENKTIDYVDIIQKKPVFESAKRAACIFSLFDIAKVFKDTKPDVVHLHGATNLNFISVLLLCFLYNSKLFIDCHADENNSNVNSKFNLFYYKVFMVLYMVFDSRIDGFITVAPSCTDYLKKYFKINDNKITFAPLCFDSDIMKLDSDMANRIKREHSIPNNAVCFGYFGKISPEKDVLESLMIFLNYLKLYGNDHFFFLVGDGEPSYVDIIERFIVENNIEENVIKLPLLSSQELAGYFNICDFCFWLGTASNSIQESMACGVIPIFSKKLVTPFLLVDERQVLPVDNLVYSATILNDLLLMNNRRKILASYSLEYFSWDISAKLHIKLYKGE